MTHKQSCHEHCWCDNPVTDLPKPRYILTTEGYLEPAARGQWFKQEDAQWVADCLNGLSRTPYKYLVKKVTKPWPN